MVPKAKPRTHACSALAAPGNPPEPYAWALYRWNVERPRCLPLMADTDVALRNAIQYQPSTYLGRPDWWASGRLVLDNQTAETLNTVVREHQKISQGTVGVAKVVADLMLGAGVMLLGKGGRSAHGRPVDYEANLWAAHSPVRVLDRHYDANGPSPAPNARAGPPARSEPPATPQSRRPPRTHLQTASRRRARATSRPLLVVCDETIELLSWCPELAEIHRPERRLAALVAERPWLAAERK